jgi:hypothetical protein
MTHNSHVTVTTVLALATLGSATQIGSFLYFVTLPMMAKASSHMAVAVAVVYHCGWCYCAKLCKWKHCFKS